MRYFLWIIVLSSQLVLANEKQAPATNKQPKAVVTVTDSKVSAKCKITHKGQETVGVDEQCTHILNDVFSSLRQKTQAAKK